MTEPALPRQLSCESRSSDFRPDFTRVGVKINGLERDDIIWYDTDRGLYRTVMDRYEKDKTHEGVVEPYWRYPESRQMRRARERWEGKQQ